MEQRDSTGDNRWSADQIKFQVWLATPSAQRSPRQQQELAAELGVSEVTLCRWKHLPGWHDAVYEHAMPILTGELMPILAAQVAQAKNGSLPHAQWLFELAGKWSPKQRVEHAGADGAPMTFTISIDRKDDSDD